MIDNLGTSPPSKSLRAAASGIYLSVRIETSSSLARHSSLSSVFHNCTILRYSAVGIYLRQPCRDVPSSPEYLPLSLPSPSLLPSSNPLFPLVSLHPHFSLLSSLLFLSSPFSLLLFSSPTPCTFYLSQCYQFPSLNNQQQQKLRYHITCKSHHSDLS